MGAWPRRDVLFTVLVYSAILLKQKATGMGRLFAECHDDFALNPKDGPLNEYAFPWLGVIQYAHVTTGLAHTGRSPRGVLLHRQFVVTTAKELVKVPKNYKLDKVIFGQYERDEMECGLSQLQLQMGMACPRAYIEVPVQDITIHPEYLRFGLSNSLGLIELIRPLTSRYMLPICLPSTAERWRRRENKVVFMVDYVNGVPLNFETEVMAKKTLKLYTDKECRRHRKRYKLGDEGVTQLLCTSGCGMRVGAPIATQNTGGAFELVGVSVGGSPCSSRAMRSRLNEAPPIFIDVYPYVNWIINIISAKIFPQPYPTNVFRRQNKHIVGKYGPVPPFGNFPSFGDILDLKKEKEKDVTEESSEEVIPKYHSSEEEENSLRPPPRRMSGLWRGREYTYGTANCLETWKRSASDAVFYRDKFSLTNDLITKVYVNLKITASDETVIDCCKLFTPNVMVDPRIRIDTFNMTLVMTTEWFPASFIFTVALMGRNATSKEKKYHQEIRGPRKYPKPLDARNFKQYLKQDKET